MATEVADGVFQLAPLPYVNVFAVRGDDAWTIVDAGMSQVAGRLVRELRRLGVRDGDVERIVLTHGHADHAGGVQRVRAELGAKEVLLGAGDVTAVRRGVNASGGRGSLLERIPAPLPGYPEVTTAAAFDGPLAIGDGRSLVPVATPGHTDGHVAFHLPDADVVIGGDAVFNVFRLIPSPGFLCSDIPRNRASILKIADLRPRTLLLSHGDPVHGDVHGRLHTIAA